MSVSKNGKRVILSSKNVDLLKVTLSDLKQQHCKLNLSDLVNEIVRSFFEKNCGKSMSKIEEKFFDQKQYLKSLLSSGGSGELDDSLRVLVKKIQNKTKKDKVSSGGS